MRHNTLGHIPRRVNVYMLLHLHRVRDGVVCQFFQISLGIISSNQVGLTMNFGRRIGFHHMQKCDRSL